MNQSIGNFLLRRLQEAGIRHIFGVPGDYNLELMQQLEDRGEPAWIGNCNELNASYATDAYARINGLGALIVTHGVGATQRDQWHRGRLQRTCSRGLHFRFHSTASHSTWRSDAPHSRRSRKRELLSYVRRGDGCPSATHSGECGSGDRSAHSDGVAPKTSSLPGTALRHLLSRDRGARTSSQTRNDPERPGQPESLHRDDSGEIEGRQVACVSTGSGCDPLRRLPADHGTRRTISDAGRDAELC